MIWEALHPGADDDGTDGGIPLRELLILGVATSVDALAVGISFAFLEVDIAGAVLAIGVVTFALTLVGVRLGHRAGRALPHPGRGRSAASSSILIGTRILLDHLGVL